jgi:protein-tyrosine phosphatase
VSRLTDRDLTTLEDRHIHTVIDFRGVAEAAKAPDHLLPGTKYQLCPAGSDSLPNMNTMVAEMKKGRWLEKFYGNTAPLGARYKPFFQSLLQLPEGESLMYHCTGGRDRTGMATALFLHLVGVPMETIEADFTASNIYLQPMNGRMFRQMPGITEAEKEELTKAMALRPELLRIMFASIREKHGSLEAFYEQELGIDAAAREALIRKYTR